MKKLNNKNNGITLVALVLTIVILLILTGITTAQLTGSGLLKKTQLAAKETKYANAYEKISLAINASYDSDGELNKDLLKENLNNIDGINPKVDEIKYNLTIIVDGYKFMINENGNILNQNVITASDVEFIPENKEWKVTNVYEAIEYLHKNIKK